MDTYIHISQTIIHHRSQQFKLMNLFVHNNDKIQTHTQAYMCVCVCPYHVVVMNK